MLIWVRIVYIAQDSWLLIRFLRGGNQQNRQGLTLVVDSYHPEMVGALQEAARHGDLRALDTTLSTPADPNQVGDFSKSVDLWLFCASGGICDIFLGFQSFTCSI